MSRRYKIAVLEGDGIGREVVPSAKAILIAAAEKNSLDVELVDCLIGESAYKRFGRTFPPETLETMKECGSWILGPLQSESYPKEDKDFPMTSGKIRKAFDLYANIRPTKSLLPKTRKSVDLVIVRENTQDFYPDRNLFRGYGEFLPDPDTVLSLRVITRNACRRIAEVAFEIARRRKEKKITMKKSLVTAVHKANVLREGDGLFLEETRKVAERYSSCEISLEERLVDSTALLLVTEPERFDVILTTNLFGDILSDEAAGLVGGLGLAPSLNLGERYAMAQAVHGSAPEIAGKGIANPVAEILSSAMLLDWMSSKHRDDPRLRSTAVCIESAVLSILREARREELTPDLGGSSSTEEFTKKVIWALEKQNL